MIKAGFGVATIDPTPPVFLAGFGARTQPANKIHDSLQARALCLDDGTTKLCLIVCDLLGMSPGFAQPARDGVAAALEIPRPNVMISCTHTHAGPSAMAGTEALGWPNPPGFGDVIRDGCIKAATQANSSYVEIELAYVRAPLPDGFAFNRRGGAYEAPTFNVLDVLGTGGRIGVVANLSIHPVLLGPDWLEVSTDWVGPFRAELEHLAGGTAIQLTGSLGDINPTPPEGKPEESYEPWASAEQTASYGRRLASVVARALDDEKLVDGDLRVVRHETITAPVGGTPISAMVGADKLDVELVEWEIGDVRVVSLPGEAFHLLGREIAAARGDRVLLAGIANAWHGYLPHPWGDGYEEGVSYGEAFVKTVREALVAAP